MASRSNANSAAIALATDFIGQFFWERYNEQPWYRKIANTFTTVIGTAATVLGQLLVLGFDLPEWAGWVILGVTTLGTVLGVYNTKNGLSKSQMDTINSAAEKFLEQRRRKLNKIHVPLEGDHDDIVDDFSPSDEGRTVTVAELQARIRKEMERAISDRVNNYLK